MSDVRDGEWSELGSWDIDHTTREARVRARVAIESIRPLADQKSDASVARTPSWLGGQEWDSAVCAARDDKANGRGAAAFAQTMACQEGLSLLKT